MSHQSDSEFHSFNVQRESKYSEISNSEADTFTYLKSLHSVREVSRCTGLELPLHLFFFIIVTELLTN